MPRISRRAVVLSLLLTALLLPMFGCMLSRKERLPMPESEEVFICRCDPENFAALRPEVRQAFLEVATVYYRVAGEKLQLTSARRSLRHCAELMAGFGRKQLESLYCRNGYPDYIRSIVLLQESQDEPLSSEQVYQILRKRQSGYISWHLAGAAVDISSRISDPELLRKLLQERGFSVFDEQASGIACLHATYQGISPEIIRE